MDLDSSGPSLFIYLFFSNMLVDNKSPRLFRKFITDPSASPTLQGCLCAHEAGLHWCSRIGGRRGGLSS